MNLSHLLQVRSWAIGAALVASTLWCGYGVWQSGLFVHNPWAEPGTSQLGAIMLAAILVLGRWFAQRTGRDAGTVALVGGMIVATCFAGLGAIGAVVLQLVAAFCIGRRLYPAYPTDDSARAHAAVAIACGLGVQSLLVGVFSFLPINNAAVYLLLLALPITIGWRDNLLAAGRAWSATGTSQGSDRWSTLLQLIIAFALMMRLLAVLRPEVGTDALAMHLAIAEQLKNDGRFHYDVTQSIWAVMPMGVDWLYAIANMLEGQQAARLVNLAADALVVLLIHEHAGRAWGRLAGAVAAVLYATTPLVYLETVSLFVENMWTLWVAAALLAGLRCMRAMRTRDAVAAGLLVGAALASKVFTILLAPFFIFLVALWIWNAYDRGTRQFAGFAVSAGLVGCLPYANAWLRTGNPVFPFMNNMFKSPLFDSTSSFDNPAFVAHADWRTLYDVTFHSGRYLEAEPGAMGIAWLVLLPATLVFAIFDSWRSRLATLAALVFVLLVFHFLAYLRYVLPVLPVLAVLMGAMVAWVARGSAAMRMTVLTLVAVLAVAGVFLTPTSTYVHRALSMPLFAGSEAEEQYLAKRLPEQRLARVIDAMQFNRVLWLGMPLYAGADTDVFATNWHGGWAQVGEFKHLNSTQSLQAWVARHKFNAIALAADADACKRQFVCDFLATKAYKVYEDGAVALYVPHPDVLFDRELLRNGSFDRGVDGWDGPGTYVVADGAVVVSAQAPFSQAVAATAGASYALEVEGRCAAGKGSYRSQVNWLDATGGFLATDIAVFECTPSYENHAMVVTAPAGTAKAIVYASGHQPDRSAEITRVSFRQ